MPAKAGIQKYLKTLDSRLRGHDAKGRIKTFYENINFVHEELFFIYQLFGHRTAFSIQFAA